MRIMEIYSHLNGYEHFLVHKLALWQELVDVIDEVDPAMPQASMLAKDLQGQLQYSSIALLFAYQQALMRRAWRVPLPLPANEPLTLPLQEQQQTIFEAGLTPIYSYNQTDFVKDRIAVEAQFGKYAFVAYDLFVKHMAFYVSEVIDVGVEILPMKEMQAHMSSGISHYEGELYNVLRHGRSTPAVPLVLIGVAP